MTTSDPTGARRRYDSPVRRRRAAETRERIIGAGAELVHGAPIWNWRALTVRAVAERAGVTERTVYRHFAGERELRDAVIERLEADAGVALYALTLDNLTEFTASLLGYVSAFPLESRSPDDPTLRAAHERLRDALLAAVAPATPGWPPGDRAVVAGMFDVLWSVMSYEKLVIEWGLGAADATSGITWVMGLVADAVRAGERPGS